MNTEGILQTLKMYWKISQVVMVITNEHIEFLIYKKYGVLPDNEKSHI